MRCIVCYHKVHWPNKKYCSWACEKMGAARFRWVKQHQYCQKAKYPPYPKKYDLRCSVTEGEIRRIRKLKKEGWSNPELAKLFDVSWFTIWYWTVSDEEREAWITRRRQYVDNPDNPVRRRQLKRRQYRILSAPLRKYLSQHTKKYSEMTKIQQRKSALRTMRSYYRNRLNAVQNRLK